MIITKQNSKLSEIKENFTFIFDRDPKISGNYLCFIHHVNNLFLGDVYCDVEPDGTVLWATTPWDFEILAWCDYSEFVSKVKKELPFDVDEWKFVDLPLSEGECNGEIFGRVPEED